jgi:hypothetical protein
MRISRQIWIPFNSRFICRAGFTWRPHRSKEGHVICRWRLLRKRGVGRHSIIGVRTMHLSLHTTVAAPASTDRLDTVPNTRTTVTQKQNHRGKAMKIRIRILVVQIIGTCYGVRVDFF